MMTFRHISIALGALVVAGCAARQIELPANHPANPAASEAPVPPDSATLKNEAVSQAQTPDDEAPIGGHAQDRHTPPADAAVYQCPMHPDVHSDKPGRCPKCGMHLKKGDG